VNFTDEYLRVIDSINTRLLLASSSAVEYFTGNESKKVQDSTGSDFSFNKLTVNVSVNILP